LSFIVSASGAAVSGRIELCAGAEVAISVMPPMPTAWWLRPVRSAWREGEHRAVVWKRLNRSPSPANRSKVGVLHGPPNTLEEPNPASSSMITRTFGPPVGGRSGSIGGTPCRGPSRRT
jgi:hypothetical protein